LSENLPEQVHRRPGTEVAVSAQSSGGGLDAGDILIPRLKLAQGISGVVTSRIVDYGAIFVAASRDDLEPEVMAEAPPKGEQIGKAVRFYVLGDPRKGWSWTQPDNELGRGSEYPDLRFVKGNDPRNVRRTYDYLITLPAYPTLPVRFLMHGAWGGQAAKQLNTQLLLQRQKGVESHTVAFKLQARLTSSPSGGQERAYVQAIIGLDKVAAKDKASDLELVESHLDLVGSAASVRTVEDEDTTAPAAPAADTPSLD
jgi:hypothetical protein